MMVDIDEEAFTVAGVGFARAGDVATLTLPPAQDGDQPREVTVPCDGDALVFFPERSAGQKQVLAALGR